MHSIEDQALAAGAAGDDEAARELVAPLLEKTTFPEDDGEDVDPDPVGDGYAVDQPADLPEVSA